MVSETEVFCLYGDDAAVSMTLPLIADIHGNLTALETVLDALRVEPTSEIVRRGDGQATT
jgi:predicted phosphodiesterase